MDHKISKLNYSPSSSGLPEGNVYFKDDYRSEKEIWSEFKQGSDAALSYIYRQYTNPMYNYGCQIIKDSDFVRDCVQDLFMDLIKTRQKLGDVVAIKPYLFLSLRRKIFRRLKKERGQMTEELLAQHESDFEIISSAESRMINEQLTAEKRELINKACQKLTAKQKEAVLLYFYEGFSYKQVAEIMGMGSVKSARVLVYRSLDVLESYLKRIKDKLLIILLICSAILINFFN